MSKSLLESTNDQTVKEMCAQACSVRDAGKGCVVSFSPKVFIPLTRLCRDFCNYCVFRQSPRQAESLYMSPEEVLEVARKGEAAGCREALFVLGERPEERYSEARAWLQDHGYESTIHYLREMCELVLRETYLYPHSNPGTMTRSELQTLKEVNVSMGWMLESTSERLYQSGGPHEHAPSKQPQVRLKTLELAGELGIPFTTGLLVGIGETPQERIDALLAIKDLQESFGHIQEVIIQNFCAKSATPMEQSPQASPEEMLETVALARILLGPGDEPSGASQSQFKLPDVPGCGNQRLGRNLTRHQGLCESGGPLASYRGNAAGHEGSWISTESAFSHLPGIFYGNLGLAHTRTAPAASW